MTTSLGYDPLFLGVTVPLPTPPDELARKVVELPYVHFTVLMHPTRALAVASSVVIDGASLVDLDRGRDKWLLDERIPATAQTGPEVYEDNDLDRGHLTRRRDPVWGAMAKAANTDTFHYTNAAPQVAAFNQSKDLWNGLEDYVLANASAYRRRLAVHTGPVLTTEDPTYRGVAIPRAFYKVVAFIQDGQLAATGYVLDQAELLDDFLRHPLRADRTGSVDEAEPLGAYRTFQVPIVDITALTSLDFGPLAAADLYRPPTPSLTPDAPTETDQTQSGTEGQFLGRWRVLESPADLALTSSPQ